ncbi:MAG: hypothetical protein K2W85_12100 [Phycisphaerales bacterium]|nr:hypothetical protein [Phycisphaerales bacterium]
MRFREHRIEGVWFPIIACASACVMSLAGGCASDPTKGYAFASAQDETVRTVAVPVFKNPTYSEGVEVDLTDAIIKEIQRSTPWRVAPEGTANTTLIGTLTDSRMRRLSIARGTGLAQELLVELTVDFEFKDVRTGKVLIARKNFTASDTFVPTRPVGERLELGQHGAVQKLARDIVAELRSDW